MSTIVCFCASCTDSNEDIVVKKDTKSQVDPTDDIGDEDELEPNE